MLGMDAAQDVDAGAQQARFEAAGTTTARLRRPGSRATAPSRPAQSSSGMTDTARRVCAAGAVAIAAQCGSGTQTTRRAGSIDVSNPVAMAGAYSCSGISRSARSPGQVSTGVPKIGTAGDRGSGA